MDGQHQSRWVVAAQYATLIAAMAGVACLAVPIYEAGRWAVHSVMGWPYDTLSIAEYLNIEGKRSRLLDLHKAFLLVPVAVPLFWLTGRMEQMSYWLTLDPEEREIDKERKRQAAKARLEASKIEEARKKQELLDYNEKRKAERKPMSGWRRLWIVFSIIFGAIAATLAWEPTKKQYVVISDPVPKSSDAFERIPAVRAAIERCEWGRYEAGYLYGSPTARTYEIRCPAKDPFTPSLIWALIPAFIMAAVGLTGRWVYRGFRPNHAAAKIGEGE